MITIDVGLNVTPEGAAVVASDFYPIAFAIRDLQSSKDWPLGPAVGGTLFYVICTLTAAGCAGDDPLMLKLKAMVESIANGRAREVVEGN